MANIEVIFLGTSSNFPTKDRNHPSIYFRYWGDRFLFDCGEGTQRQMYKADLSPTKLKAIFITHWHGDHSLGIGGILQSLSASGIKRKIYIVGPEGTKERIDYILKAYSFHLKPKLEIIELNLDKGEIKEIEKVSTKKYKIYAIGLDHSISNLAFYFKEKDYKKANKEKLKELGLLNNPLVGKLKRGKEIEWKGKIIKPEDVIYNVKGFKLTYIVDTKYFDELIEFAKESDVLIVEGMFLEEDKEEAKEKKHLTVKEAAKIAKESKSKSLYLIHISQRYSKRLDEVLKEAKEVFENSYIANDFDRLEFR